MIRILPWIVLAVSAGSCGGGQTPQPPAQQSCASLLAPVSAQLQGLTARLDSETLQDPQPTLDRSNAFLAARLGSRTFSIDFARDVDGREVTAALGTGAFPICVRLAKRTTTSGFAQVIGSRTFTTDAERTGWLVMLDAQSGRFEFQAAGYNAGAPTGEVLQVTAGEFRIP